MGSPQHIRTDAAACRESSERVRTEMRRFIIAAIGPLGARDTHPDDIELLVCAPPLDWLKSLLGSAEDDEAAFEESEQPPPELPDFALPPPDPTEPAALPCSLSRSLPRSLDLSEPGSEPRSSEPLRSWEPSLRREPSPEPQRPSEPPPLEDPSERVSTSRASSATAVKCMSVA